MKHTIPAAAELPVPAEIEPEDANALRQWVQSIVDARVLALIPYIKAGMAEGVYAKSVELLERCNTVAKRIADEQAAGDEWKNGPLSEE